jgi:hypothetical protein
MISTSKTYILKVKKPSKNKNAKKYKIKVGQPTFCFVNTFVYINIKKFLFCLNLIKKGVIINI